MDSAITWYDVLGVLPGASSEQIRDAYQSKSKQLGPDRISGAQSKVVAAADRGRRTLDAAWRVLCESLMITESDTRPHIPFAGCS
jgi:curved DNA-binding protein CbpA